MDKTKIHELEARIARLEKFITDGQQTYSDFDGLTGAENLLVKDSLITFVLGEVERRLYVSVSAKIAGFDD